MRCSLLYLFLLISGCSYPRYTLERLDGREWMQDFIRPEETMPQGGAENILRYTQNLRQIRDPDDHWQYPAETLQKKGGDCEDKAFLLLSMLIKAGIKEAQGVKGRYLGQGHMWVEYNGYILDPSRKNTRPIPIKKSIGYTPFFKFDEDNIYFCNTEKEKQ